MDKEARLKPQTIAAMEKARREKAEELARQQEEAKNPKRHTVFGDIIKDVMAEEQSQANHEEQPSPNNGETSPEVYDKKTIIGEYAERSGDTMDDYIGVLELSAESLPTDNLRSILNHISEINEINKNSIGKLEERGELDESDKKMITSLNEAGIDPTYFTRDEVYGLIDYISNATDEAVEMKLDITDALVSNMIGVLKSNKIFFNEYYLTELCDIRDSLIRYGRGIMGDIRTFEAEDIEYELAFPMEKYKTADDKLAIDVDKVIDRWERMGIDDDPFNREMIRFCNEGGLIDLINEGYVSEEDFLAYGPLTLGELKIIDEVYTMIGGVSYVYDGIDNRNKGSTSVHTEKTTDENGNVIETKKVVTPRPGATLMNILNESAPLSYKTDKVEGVLDTKYIEGFLQNRRLPAKEIVTLVCSFVPEAMKLEKPQTGNKEIDDKIDIAYRNMRSSCSWLCYFAGIALSDLDERTTMEKLKEKYGTKRPTTDEYIEELKIRIANFEEERFKKLDERSSGYITKLDEHLKIANSNYEYIKNAGKGSQLYSSDLD